MDDLQKSRAARPFTGESWGALADVKERLGEMKAMASSLTKLQRSLLASEEKLSQQLEGATSEASGQTVRKRPDILPVRSPTPAVAALSRRGASRRTSVGMSVSLPSDGGAGGHSNFSSSQ